MRRLLVLVVLLAFAAPARAQVGPDQAARDALHWTGHEKLVDVTSTVLVGVALFVPCFDNRDLSATETVSCLRHQGIQVGLGILAAELTKRLVHRPRPDASNDLSFYSEHTELACLSVIRTRWLAVCPAVAVLRIAANKHWLTDTAAGAGAAGVLSIIRW